MENIIKLLKEINTITNEDSFVGCYLDMSFKLDLNDEYLYISLSSEDLTNVDSFNYCDDEFIDVTMIDLQDLDDCELGTLDTINNILKQIKKDLKGGK